MATSRRWSPPTPSPVRSWSLRPACRSSRRCTGCGPRQARGQHMATRFTSARSTRCSPRRRSRSSWPGARCRWTTRLASCCPTPGSAGQDRDGCAAARPLGRHCGLLRREVRRGGQDAIPSNRDYYQFVSGLPMTFAPGTRRQYCNGCYIVLGEIVARSSGMAYEDYIDQHVFQPAGMKIAAFCGRSARREHGYRTPVNRRTDRRSAQQCLHARSGGQRSGGAYASAADLLAFADALRHERLLDT